MGLFAGQRAVRLGAIIRPLRFVASAVCQLLGACLAYVSYEIWGVDAAHAFSRSLFGLPHYLSSLLLAVVFLALAVLLLPIGRLRFRQPPPGV